MRNHFWIRLELRLFFVTIETQTKTLYILKNKNPMLWYLKKRFAISKNHYKYVESSRKRIKISTKPVCFLLNHMVSYETFKLTMESWKFRRVFLHCCFITDVSNTATSATLFWSIVSARFHLALVNFKMHLHLIKACNNYHTIDRILLQY